MGPILTRESPHVCDAAVHCDVGDRDTVGICIQQLAARLVQARGQNVAVGCSSYLTLEKAFERTKADAAVCAYVCNANALSQVLTNILFRTRDGTEFFQPTVRVAGPFNRRQTHQQHTRFSNEIRFFHGVCLCTQRLRHRPGHHALERCKPLFWEVKYSDLVCFDQRMTVVNRLEVLGNHVEGFDLGMRDVAALCDCIVDARDDQEESLDCGSAVILENYAEWRRSDQKKLVRFTDGIVRLFGDQRPPVPALRDLGMLAFDMIPGVRRTFAKHTMGLAGRLPRLSRGVPLA